MTRLAALLALTAAFAPAAVMGTLPLVLPVVVLGLLLGASLVALQPAPAPARVSERPGGSARRPGPAAGS